MSIAYTGEIDTAITGSENWKVQRQYVRQFLFTATDKLNYVAAILAHGSSPARLAPYPSDALALVKDRKVAKSPQNPFHWILTCNYDSVFEFDPATTDENPLARPAIITGSFEHATKAIREDNDGFPIASSDGLPANPPQEMDCSIGLLQIDINVASISYAIIATYQDAVNSDTWNGFDIGTVKVRGINFKQVWENNVLYWQKTWQLAIKWDGWEPIRILDQSNHHLGNSAIVATEENGVLYQNRDKFGQPFANPCKLDGDGNLLDPQTDPGVYLEYFIHRSLTFSGVVGL